MTRRILKMVYVHPSRYDDEGYVVRYWRGVLPSNTLLCLKALTEGVADSGELGEDVTVVVEGYHDPVERVPVSRLARQNRRKNMQVVVGLVGVQSNQFARAADLALELRTAGIQVIIGGFHVSGILALYDKPSPELQNLIDHGVSLVKGEVEAPGVLSGILNDALHRNLRPIYDIKESPCLDNAPVPLASKRDLRHFFSGHNTTVDTSRGCPFDCSFCTIINVQGRKMRSRSSAALLERIESHYRNGIRSFFFTDDNFSRSPIWEELLDGLIVLRERGVPIKFMMQIDTMAYRIPHFIEKAARAGCFQVFVGVESMNAQNLVSAGKNQNRVQDYVAMVDAWHALNILVYAGYIIGFPYDTPESVAKDVETLSTEVKVDTAAFFMLTPLPGSRDHKKMTDTGVPLDADLNNYDACHETFAHPNFAPGAWKQTCRRAWESFYTKEKITNILLRTPRELYWRSFWTLVYFRYCALTNTHPMMTGLIPVKGFRRRPNYPRESLFKCLARRVRDTRIGIRYYVQILYEFEEIWLLTRTTTGPGRDTLKTIHLKWASTRQHISQYSLQDQCSRAAEEIRALLSSISEHLHQLSIASGSLRKRTQHAVFQKAQMVDEYLTGFTARTPSWEGVRQAENFITEGVISEYESIALNYVAKRRLFNRFHRELTSRLRSGQILVRDFFMLLGEMCFEGFLAIRFALVVLTECVYTHDTKMRDIENR